EPDIRLVRPNYVLVTSANPVSTGYQKVPLITEGDLLEHGVLVVLDERPERECGHRVDLGQASAPAAATGARRSLLSPRGQQIPAATGSRRFSLVRGDCDVCAALIADRIGCLVRRHCIPLASPDQSGRARLSIFPINARRPWRSWWSSDAVFSWRARRSRRALRAVLPRWPWRALRAVRSRSARHARR